MQFATLVPAYKTQYMVELLNALRCQTVRPDLIIVSDDSPHGTFRELMQSTPYLPLTAGLPIEYAEGPRRGAYENFKHLVKLWAGRSDYVHVMLDDDLIYPDFYERHRRAHASGHFSCSVSRRWSASESGQPTSSQTLPAALADSPRRMASLADDVIFLTAVARCHNWLGEFSNAVFRADCVDLLLEPRMGGVSYAGLWDLGAFVAAAMRRPICHIQDHLGSFRISPGQNSSKLNSPIMKGAHLGYVALAVGGRRSGRLADGLLRQCCELRQPALSVRYGADPEMSAFCALLPELAQGLPAAEDRFVDTWHAFLRDHEM